MTKKNLYIYVSDSGHLEILINPIFDWEGFDRLIQYLEAEFSAITIMHYDGPGTRRWVLECDGCQFELIHDDGYGNYLKASTKDSEATVLEIGKDIDRKLGQIDS